MIMLRPMGEEEYPAYLEYFIADYAREIAANYRLSAEDSLARAKREIAEDLPEGVNTPGQVLLCLFNQADHCDEHVGYLWYKPDTATQTVFIFDFISSTPARGRGWARRRYALLSGRCESWGLNRFDFAWPEITNEPATSTSLPAFG